MGSACVCGKTDPVLFDQLGGEQGLATIVRIFYGKVVKDDRINWMFEEEVDLRTLIAHVELFMSSAFGGPCIYDGKNIRTAHCLVNNGKYPYKIHFKAVVENMVNTMSELNISEKAINDVRRFILSTESDVLGYNKVRKSDQNVKPQHCHGTLKEQPSLQNVGNLRASKSDDKLREADVGGSVSSLKVSSRKDSPKFEHIVPTDGSLDEDVNLSSIGRRPNDTQKDEKRTG